MIRLATVFLVLGAQAAMACPQSLDPQGGLVLTRTDPFFAVILKATEEGLTEQRVMERDSGPEPVSTLYPHPLVVGERAARNGTLSLSYATAVSQLDRLNETGVWQSDVVLRSGQDELGRGTATLSFRGNQTMSVGECRYDVWHVEDRLELEGRAPIIFDKFYSPTLGVVLEAVKLTPNREPITMISFDKIEAATAF